MNEPVLVHLTFCEQPHHYFIKFSAIKSQKVRRKILILRRKYGKLHYISY